MTCIPLAKPDFDDRELEAVRRVLESGWVVQGPEVEAFEGVIARMHDAKHCVAVSSGTAALHVAYLAMGIGPGDAVFVPSFAWPSAANMAVAVGARPVFVDVLSDTYNIDPQSLEREIIRCLESNWAKPRAVVPVHQFGLAADMDATIKLASKYELDVIEDAACALGATLGGKPVGTFGAAGTFSFHPRKAVTTGEGGAIVTDDESLAESCRVWRNHGQVMEGGHRDFGVPGLNYRLTEVQAAIGRVQLDKFPQILTRRREIAATYLDELAGSPLLQLPAWTPEHTWQTFMVVLDDALKREDIIKLLVESGVQVGAGSVSGHCGAVYRERYEYRPSDLPHSAALHGRGLALPLHSRMSMEDIQACIDRVRSIDQHSQRVPSN